MSSVVPWPDSDAIEAEASAWFALRDAGELSEEQEAEFREWLERSPKHREAWNRVNAAWNGLEDLFELSDQPSAQDTSLGALLGRLVARRPFLTAACAAATLAVFAIPVAFLMLLSQFRLEHDPTLYAHTFYASDIGEQRLSQLPDGSTLRLNTQSQAELDYTPDARIIRLLRGEAIFNVASNPQRPFLVYAGSGVVRAVGTTFAVRMFEDKVEVIVTEGAIDLGRAARLSGQRDSVAPEGSDARVRAGQRAYYDTSRQQVETIDTPAPEVIDRNLSWMSGMLVFEGDTLEAVINEVGRYSTTQIVISDPKIRELRIGGYFKTGEVDALLRTLETGFGLEVQRESDNLVYISGPTG